MARELVAPPATRKQPEVHVNRTLIVKRSRENPIDRDIAFVAPTRIVQRKIMFIFNDMTELNYQNKVNIE